MPKSAHRAQSATRFRVLRGGDYIADEAVHRRVLRDTANPDIGPVAALDGVDFTRMEVGDIVTLPPWAESDYLEIGAIECVDHALNADGDCTVCRYTAPKPEANDG